jgi:hypothetical protein
MSISAFDPKRTSHDSDQPEALLRKCGDHYRIVDSRGRASRSMIFPLSCSRLHDCPGGRRSAKGRRRRAFKMATIFCASAIALRSSSARFAVRGSLT